MACSNQSLLNNLSTMKRKTASFTGTRPIFTGSPSIVQGGSNLDVANQAFAVGDVIPAGTLAIRDEAKRTVQIIKTAKVSEVDSEDATKVSLYVDEFYKPCFAVGDLVLVSGSAATTIASVPSIKAIEKKGNAYVITLSAAIAGLKAGDVLEEVISDGQTSAKSTERGKANSVTICDVEVDEFETSVDVSADTMQYAMYERRVPPIPASQKDTTGAFLNANPHIKLTQSY